jgi:beta-N-acetylhexosaminidase
LNQPPARIVVGLEGEALSERECRLFSARMPAGFILFARNCRDAGAIRALVASLHALDPSRSIPVMIDQEGGRVVRIREPICAHLPPLAAIGCLGDQSRAKEMAYAHGRVTAAQLEAFGINVNCAPCLDVAQPDVTWAIGDRAFSGDPGQVATLGRAMMSGMMDGGLLPVIKHLPGHGRATVDSHLELPLVDADPASLRETDFRPFKALRDSPFAMTAHIVFSAIDSEHPATQSSIVIERIIRGEIGFQGILLSDDLSMKALGGGIVDRATASLDAGCDLALHCNGRFEEIEALLTALPPMDTYLEAKLEETMRRRAVPNRFDADTALEALKALT